MEFILFLIILVGALLNIAVVFYRYNERRTGKATEKSQQNLGSISFLLNVLIIIFILVVMFV